MNIYLEKRKVKALTPVRVVVLSFFVIIMIGGFLLFLPISSATGNFTPYEDAMFTATSATCVTGLAVYDTWAHFSVFGQIVILSLIQIGGLGLVTFTTGFTLLFRQKLGLKSLALAKENTGVEDVNMSVLIRTVLVFTFVMELTGTLILMIRFVPMIGPLGIWVSAFTSISAFCNAGFDIFTALGTGISTPTFAADPLVALPLIALIVIGGIGFIVVSDIYQKLITPTFMRKPRGRLLFHSKVVLIATAIILIFASVLTLISEHNSALSQYNFAEKCLVSLFQAASSRTAGFSPIDPADQNILTKSIAVIVMFIGGSPSSTAGGIKTTTFFVMICTIYSVLRGKEHPQFMKHRISTSNVFSAITIIFLGVSIVLTVSLILYLTVPDALAIDCLYESVSGFSTTGFNAPFTPYLPLFPKIILTLTMFIGRVGTVSLGLFFVNRRNRRSESVLPYGTLLVG